MAELRATTDLTRIWIHADLDAFFASVEELDDPSLVGIERPPCVLISFTDTGHSLTWYCRGQAILAAVTIPTLSTSQLGCNMPSDGHSSA